MKADPTVPSIPPLFLASGLLLRSTWVSWHAWTLNNIIRSMINYMGVGATPLPPPLAPPVSSIWSHVLPPWKIWKHKMRCRISYITSGTTPKVRNWNLVQMVQMKKSMFTLYSLCVFDIIYIKLINCTHKLHTLFADDHMIFRKHISRPTDLFFQHMADWLDNHHGNNLPQDPQIPN